MNYLTKSTTQQLARGFTLTVTLILLLVLTLAALASMRGTALQERMAVGQVQMHSAFLESEQIAWDAAACIRSLYIDADGDFIEPLPATAAVETACGAEGAVVAWDESRTPFRYNVSAALAFAETGAVTPVALEVFTPGSLGSDMPPPPLPRLAPYACFGPNCQLTEASGRSSPTADGTNRMSPNMEEEDFNCGARGANRPAVNPEGGSVPGVIMPDGTINGTLSTATESTGNPAPDVVGDPPLINNVEDWEASASYVDYRTYIDSVVDPLVEALDGGNSGTRQLAAGDAGVFVAEAGQTITLESGANAASFGVIILDGGELILNGNQCFVGSVIFRNGGRITSSSGTGAIVGSVIGYAPDDQDDIINPRLNGTPSFYFSSKALQDAEEIIAGELGPGYIFELVQWRSPIEVGS